MSDFNKDEANQFYDAIAGETYLREVRRFCLRYDEMVSTIVELLQIQKPRKILDIGCGVGNVDERILKAIPRAKLTCVEQSTKMAEVAQKRLGKKCEIVRTDALDYKPSQSFDAVMSNLAIHNIEHDDKLTLLRNIHKWLCPVGIFIWGEFIDWDDRAVAERYMDARGKNAVKHGAAEDFVKEVFAKENKDPRLTVTQTVDLLRKAGFVPEVLWVYNACAVFRARKS